MAEAESVARALVEGGKLLALQDGYYLTQSLAATLCERLEKWLGDYSSRWPLRHGSSKKEVAQAVFPKFDQKQQRAFFTYLEGTGIFEQDEKSVWLKGWVPAISGDAKEIIGGIREAYSKAPFMPPSWQDVCIGLDIPSRDQGEYLQWFISSGELVRVSEDALFAPDALESAEKALRDGFSSGFTLAEARDHLGTNRKSAHLMGEYFDHIKLTYRDGEKRYWRI